MKCRMCGGHPSSLWNADELAVYGEASESAGGVVNTRDLSIKPYELLDPTHRTCRRNYCWW